MRRGVGVDARGDAEGQEAARIDAVELVEDGKVALVDVWDVVVIDEGLEGVLDLVDRFPIDMVDLLEDGLRTEIGIRQFARAEAAVGQRPQLKTVVPL